MQTMQSYLEADVSSGAVGMLGATYFFSGVWADGGTWRKRLKIPPLFLRW